MLVLHWSEHSDAIRTQSQCQFAFRDAAGYRRAPSGLQTSPGPWDTFADVEVFFDEVPAERLWQKWYPTDVIGPKPPLAGAALRKAVMAL